MDTQNRLNFGVMFSKIDVENRIVSGFATLDNVDSHGDIVEAEGSRKAFERFRGGLREMHTNNAVGTLVDFEAIKKYVEEEDKVYDGIYVNARVSKGAQDTWEKVLDGTFKGFSIGGRIKERAVKYDDAGNAIGIIKDYDLIELSLVDNPANPHATVMTVRKVGDTFVYNDDDADLQRMNVFFHAESGDVVLSADESRDGFEHIGWVDSPDDTQKIRDMVNTHKLEKGLSPSITQNDVDVLLEETETVMMDTNTEGGANVADVNKQADEVVETDDEVTEEVVEKAADVDETEELETEEVSKAADVDEVEDEQDDVVLKVTDAVRLVVDEALSKAAEAAKESKDAVSSVESSFEEALKSFETKLSELEGNLSKTLEDLGNRVQDIESDTAVKKSADVIDDDDDEAEGETNFWRGSGFLSVNDLLKG